MDLRRFLGNMAKTYLVIGALSVSAFAGADEYHNFNNNGYSNNGFSQNDFNNSCGPVCAPCAPCAPCASNTCCGTPCNEPPACGWAYNPPAYARCGCDVGCNSFTDNISGRVDFLWWRANEEGLELGTEEYVNTFTGSGTPVRNTVTNVSHTKRPKFKYDPGFRIGLINHCACDCYDVALNWTHFHTKAHVTGHTDTEEFTTFFSDWERFVNANPTTSEGRYTLNLDLLDLEMGRKYYVSNCFVLRPHVGLRGTRIDQNYRVESSSTTTDPAIVPFTAFTSSVKSRSDFLAIGPRLGLDIEVHVGCGLIVFGQAAGSIVFGTFDNHSKEHLEDFVSGTGPFIAEADYEAKSSAFRTSRTFTDMTIGLKWEHCYEWCNRLHPVSLAFAWEHHAFYDMNNFNFAPRGLTETGGTAVANGVIGRKHGDLYTQGLTVSFNFGF